MATDMVGAKGGWVEVPYVHTPCSRKDLASHEFSIPTVNFSSVSIVLGVMHRTEDGRPDVMRGEEVQVMGALDIEGIE